MKISGNAIRVGNIVEHQGRLWRAVRTQHVQPGKGGAYLQVELKDIRGGTKLNERFRAAESVERVRLDEEQHSFLYTDGEQYVFMHCETFDQINLHSDLIGDERMFLAENMEVSVASYEGEVISVMLPETTVMEITQADPVVKGQTASSSYKPAMLANGARVMVPPHIVAGTRIVVNIADGAYVERAKS